MYIQLTPMVISDDLLCSFGIMLMAPERYLSVSIPIINGMDQATRSRRLILGYSQVRHIAAAISQLKAHPIVRVCCDCQKSPFCGHISWQLEEMAQSLVAHNEPKQLQTLRNVVA